MMIEKMSRSATISSKLSQLRDMLSEIQPLTADAAQKQITDTRVKRWLTELHELAYDIDDLIDDLAATTTTTTAVDNMLNKILPKSITRGRRVMSSTRLDVITHKLQNLSREKDSLGLGIIRSSYETHTRRRMEVTSLIDPFGSETHRGRMEATSLIDPLLFVGQKGVKDILILVLVNSYRPGTVIRQGQNMDVLSVTGEEGTGKTTLARVLYNDNKVKDQFELQAWVCVSRDFDVFDVTLAMYQSLGGNEKTFVNLDLLQVALKEQLSDKSFLLVLDDVWSVDPMQWQVFQSPFLVGGYSYTSKIIVTTRNPNTPTMMTSFYNQHLGFLSNEDAMSLFAQYTLNERNFDPHPDLKLIAQGLIGKCKGLPLALKALGWLLRTKTDVEEWQELLDADIWDLQDQGGINPAIKLCYNRLPGILKQLFAYCSFFPLDYVFQKDELVLLWMAEEFLYQSNNIKSMEEYGRQCFEELLSSSFFVHSNDNQFVVPEFMRNLAMVAGKELFLTFNYENVATDENEALDKVRHLSFVRQQSGIYRNFEALLRARRLRTLLAVSASLDGPQKFFLSNKVLTDIIPQLQFLRVLNLSNYSITEIPKSVGSLKHIRYLNFSRTDIACLPEQLGDLYNLQSLLLRGCEKLFSLPKSLVNLSNLRHLDISDTPRLNKIPLGIGKLKDLQTLSKVIIEGIDGFNISELKGLLDLRGRLSIEGLHNVEDAIQVKDANLQQKKGLDDVELGWNDDFDDYVKRTTEYEVLEGLIPHHELKILKILFFGGVQFPRWVGDSSFVCLTELTLRGCRSCLRLPTLGHLKSLQKLFVEGMNGVKNVGSELLGPADSLNDSAFPSLQFLEFKDMQGWETWSICSGANSGPTTWFPSLGEISIVNCPRLDVVSVESIQ